MITDYEYQSLFYNTNISKDIIIADSGAVVTPVTGQAPIIEDAEYLFLTEDFKAESFELEEILCGEDDLKFGLCNPASVKFTVRNNPDYPNLKDVDAELTVYFYLNGDSDTLFELGTYEVDVDEYSDDRRFRTIEAYDMLYFLNDYDITEWYNSVFASGQARSIKYLRDSLFAWLSDQDDIPFTVLQDDEATLVNDSYEIGRTIESDIITFNFFMQGLLEINGCFGHIDRNGIFVYKTIPWYSEQAVKVIDDSWREPPTKYEDITTIGIGFVDVYDQNNVQLWHRGSTNFKRPSIYNIVDSFVFAGKEQNDSDTADAIDNMRNTITHLRYKPCEVKSVGNPCLEVGDQIEVQYGVDENDEPLYFYTYILERRMTGIVSLRDTFTARGNKRQPKLQLDTNSNWHVGDSPIGTTGGSGGNTGNVVFVEDEFKRNFVKMIRNIGMRVLDEPTNVSVVYVNTYNDGSYLDIKWTDPDDHAEYEPSPVYWNKTYLLHKVGSAPENRWDYGVVVEITTKNQYQTNAYRTYPTLGKKHYYGIFPADNLGNCNPCMVFCVNTELDIPVPIILSLNMGSNAAQVTAMLPLPEINGCIFNDINLVYKKGSIPTSKNDGTAVPLLDVYEITQLVVINGLDANEHYYFCIFEKELQSDQILTSEVFDAVTEIKALRILDVIVDSATSDVWTNLIDRVSKKLPQLTTASLEYDSETNSLHSTNGEWILYEDWFVPYRSLNIKKIIYRANVMITTNSSATSRSTSMGMGAMTFHLVMLGYHYNPSRIYPYMLNGAGHDGGTQILDDYRDSFHDVRAEVTLSDSKVPLKVEIFVDNEVVISDTLTGESAMNFSSAGNINFELSTDTYVKSFSVDLVV